MTGMEFLPALFMATGVVLVALATLFISSLLRPSNPYPAKNMPYECGVDPAGEAAARSDAALDQRGQPSQHEPGELRAEWMALMAAPEGARRATS